MCLDPHVSPKIRSRSRSHVNNRFLVTNLTKQIYWWSEQIFQRHLHSLNDEQKTQWLRWCDESSLSLRCVSVSSSGSEWTFYHGVWVYVFVYTVYIQYIYTVYTVVRSRSMLIPGVNGVSWLLVVVLHWWIKGTCSDQGYSFKPQVSS